MSMCCGYDYIKGALSFAVLILAICAMAETDGWDRGYYAEISAASQYFSLGSVRADKSVWILEGDVVQRLDGFGHILAGYWAQSDFENRRDSGHRSTVYESDPYLFYSYDWDIVEGWRLRNRAGMIWVFNEGYRQKVVHLVHEWTYMGEVKSPWVTLFGQARVVEHRGTYVRVGLNRVFDVADGAFSLVPHAAMSGGSERWNRRRYGDYDGCSRLSAGLGTVDYGLRAVVPIRLGVSLFLDVCGYNAINHPTRAQIRESRRHGTTRQTDACFVAAGLMWEL